MDTKDICIYLLHAGISIRPSALRLLHQHICEQVHKSSVEDFLDEVVKCARELRNSDKSVIGGSVILEDDQIKRILGTDGKMAKTEEMVESKLDQRIRTLVEGNVIVLGAYEDFPYWEKSEFDGKMKIKDNRTGQFFGEGEHKITANRNQYYLLEEMLLRGGNKYTRLLQDSNNGVYEPMVGLDEEQKEEQEMVEVPYINNLLGVRKTMQVFGTLLKKEDMHYYLEDITKSVKLIIKPDLELGPGFFLEGNTVLATGDFVNNAFILKELRHPPISRVSLPKPTEMDYFGAYNYIKKKVMKGDSFDVRGKLQQSAILPAEPGNPKEKMIVILSNVSLDNHRIMPRIKELLAGVEQLQPSVIVMMGGFFTQPQRTLSDLKTHITQFAQIVGEFEYLCTKTAWMFIPAPEDPGIAHLFPRKPIPDCLLDPLKKKLKVLINTTNPCRMSFYGKEISFCRYNLLQYCKRLAVFQSANGDVDNIVTTIMAQRSLVPVSHSYIPVVWDYAHCMSFYNPPHYTVLGDICSSYEKEVEGSFIVNPGNFSKDLSFVVLYPLLGKIEPSKLP